MQSSTSISIKTTLYVSSEICNHKNKSTNKKFPPTINFLRRICCSHSSATFDDNVDEEEEEEEGEGEEEEEEEEVKKMADQWPTWPKRRANL